MSNNKPTLAFINNCMIDVDLSTIEESNPGIGGTEYLFLNVPYQLKKYKGYDITLYSKYDIKIENENGIHLKKIKDIDDAYQDAIKNNVNILITREDMIPSNIVRSKTKLVLWLHLAHSYQETKQYANYFDNILFVSKYEKNRYCFNGTIRRKSAFVYNIVPKFTGYSIEKRNNNNTVVFIGSLNPGKGFSALTKIWPNIIKEIPQARLVVIGSGSLYNPDQRLGPLNIAEEHYEKEIISPLLQSNTQDTVTFLGKMNTYQINEELKKVDIGVTNLPTNIGETFCMTVFDFARYHIPVIVRRTGGIKEVTNKNNSFCYKSFYGLKKQIIVSLKNNKKRLEKGDKLYRDNSNKFDNNLLLNNWEDVITTIQNGEAQKENMIPIIIASFNYLLSRIRFRLLKIIYSLIRLKNKIIGRI